MGYVLMFGCCINCGRQFIFNPNKVPSVRVNGVREPVCRSCVEWANGERKKKGLELFTIPPDAYEACREEELA